LQWFDPTSIDLVHALSDRCAQTPILLLATARLEFRPPWRAQPHHKVISLAPLDEAQVQRIIAELAVRRTLSAEVTRRVSERASGVPLFVEEVTRLLLERGQPGRPAGDPADASAVARGAARQARRSARSRADQRRSGPRFSYALLNPWLTSTKARCNRRWSGSPRPTFCSSRAMDRKRTTASSTR
jgi:hypothetical protein